MASSTSPTKRAQCELNRLQHERLVERAFRAVADRGFRDPLNIALGEESDEDSAQPSLLTTHQEKASGHLSVASRRLSRR